ncbi:MAG: hypothetical protein KIT72_18235 [Polyangiaceae bacterium]|nr:hypothetical protein [Polyangiaceae bacterium]MCW5792356.1 hypothetical protein [Polyangiaceae bacterium]
MQPITGGAARRFEDNPEATSAPQGATKAGAAKPGSKPSGAEEADAPRGAALLAQQSSSRRTTSATLTGLQGRYPDAGVDVQRIASALASHSGSAASVRLKATQQFVQAALKSNPSLGGRFLEDMHLKHMPPGVRALVQQATVGQSGASLYNAGVRLANQLNGLKGAQLQRVTELVKTKPLQAAINEVLTARSASRATPMAKAMPAIPTQVAAVMKILKAEHAAVVGIKESLARHFAVLPKLSRGLEVGMAVGSHLVMPAQLPGALGHALDGNLAPAKSLWKQFQGTYEMGRGMHSARLEAARSAYAAAVTAIDRYTRAIEAYQKLLSRAPIDPDEMSVHALAVREAAKAAPEAINHYVDLFNECAEDEGVFYDMAQAISMEVVSAAASGFLAPVGGPAALVVAGEVVKGMVVSEVVGKTVKVAEALD